MVTITKERYDFHVAEIERLREALRHIANDSDTSPFLEEVARKALGEKE
jgi:hypothetical protein